MSPQKVSSQNIRAQKGQEKLVAITSYDYTFTRLVDPFADIILVGDSLGMVVQGNDNTLSVTLDQIIYHSRAVTKGAKHAHVVVDMPFMSYQADLTEALKNAGRLMAEGGAEAVKLEGGVTIAKTVERLVEIGIPVMGHVGLTPQSVHAFGGFKVQGKTDQAREAILQDALAIEEAGAYALVLEGMPAELAKEITERLKIPTIGIGAGADCDGQVLVITDLLGLNPDFQPRFVKKYANFAESTQVAVQQYAKEVREKSFPN